MKEINTTKMSSRVLKSTYKKSVEYYNTLPSRRYKRRKTLSMVNVSRNTDSTCRKTTLQMCNCNTQKIKDEEIRKDKLRMDFR